MKKTFILFIALFMVSCSGEIYEDELRVGEDNLLMLATQTSSIPEMFSTSMEKKWEHIKRNQGWSMDRNRLQKRHQEKSQLYQRNTGR